MSENLIATVMLTPDGVVTITTKTRQTVCVTVTKVGGTPLVQLSSDDCGLLGDEPGAYYLITAPEPATPDSLKPW